MHCRPSADHFLAMPLLCLAMPCYALPWLCSALATIARRCSASADLCFLLKAFPLLRVPFLFLSAGLPCHSFASHRFSLPSHCRSAQRLCLSLLCSSIAEHPVLRPSFASRFNSSPCLSCSLRFTALAKKCLADLLHAVASAVHLSTLPLRCPRPPATASSLFPRFSGIRCARRSPGRRHELHRTGAASSGPPAACAVRASSR